MKMNELNKIITDLENRLNELNQQTKSSRFNDIDKKLKCGILCTDLDNNELMYVHTKLHMIYTYKHRIIETSKLKEMHKTVSVKLKEHHINDELDH